MQSFDFNSISVYIFNWKKVTDNVEQLYPLIQSVVPDVTIINSDESYVFPSEMRTIQLDDSYYYGKQYNVAIKNVSKDKILCIIVGDVSPNTDFKLAFINTLISFNSYSAGVHAPNELHTSYTTRHECVGEQLYRVDNTDCTFWCIHPKIVKVMRELDYTISNFGWGIDCITIHQCESQGLRTLRDYEVGVKQIRKSTGYSADIAMVQLNALKQKYFECLPELGKRV